MSSHPLVAAVKFQSAFYEAYGPPGVAAMHATAAIAHDKGLIVIIDGKRNDIGSTAEAYARGYLGKVPVGGSFEPSWQADAITVNPYLGSDGVSPVHQGRRPGAQGDLRPGSHQQQFRGRVSGPGRRRQTALSPCRRSGLRMGRTASRRTRL